ncbi:MAG: CARDB domain-containing protein [Candidatus Poseidoniales archaeon]
MAKSVGVVLVLSLLIFSAIPLQVSAEDSGGIQASAATLAFLPNNPTEGGSVNIILTLSNTNSQDADDVIYSFYWDGIIPNKRIVTNTVDIPANNVTTIEVTKSGLTVGEHKVWIEFEYAGAGAQSFFVDLTVAGLPDLEVEQVITTPLNFNSGDEIEVALEISNTGSQNADASRLQLLVSNDSSIIETPEISAGQSTWVNQIITAPESGIHQISITLDIDDAVIEADEGNVFLDSLSVDSRMDISHLGNISVDIAANVLDGPWLVSGTLLRTGGDGQTEVPMKLEILDNTGSQIVIPTFSVNMTGGSRVQTDWQFELTSQHISNLLVGNHMVSAAIDPYQTANFIQETRDNDRVSTYFDKYAIPDVAVDPFAYPSLTSIGSGGNIEWTVSMTNAGSIAVQGKLLYNWEGFSADESTEPLISIAAGQTHVWKKVLPSATGAHIAQFDARWVAIGSYDDNLLNSNASGSVSITAQLRLNWQLSTFVLEDESGQLVNFPLKDGQSYVAHINLSSTEVGGLNFTCENGKGIKWSKTEVVVSELFQTVSLSCQFNASAPRTNLKIIPDDSVVVNTQTWAWDTSYKPEDVIEDRSGAAFGTLFIIGLLAVGMIGILIAAIILTRKTDEDVERDIFDYCPACDGELEDQVDRCPSCSFNLKKARKQFHDCDVCHESIPDLMSNCPYCGTPQVVSTYFEQRKQKDVTKPTVALPDEEEDAESTHAAGTEDFDEAIKEFGYDADDLEGHWDKNIAAAEAEVEAAYDRKAAELEASDMDDEEAMQIVTTNLKSAEEVFESHDIDAFLAEKGEIKAHLDQGDDGKRLSASDSSIRGQIFDVTGEKGVMPGDEVKVGYSIDRSIAGNELPEEALDFSFEEEEIDELTPAKLEKKRAPRRKIRKKVETAECGACGADIPADANGCSTCGAKFE